MPVAVSYPGVYIEEVPSGVRTITGVATSITAFIGWAPRGPVDEATLVLSWSDYYRTFGPPHPQSYLGHAVSQFFMNGGQRAYVIRLVQRPPQVNVAAPSTLTLSPLDITASNPGTWGDDYRIAIKQRDDDPTRFRLQVLFHDPDSKPDAEAVVESFENLSMDEQDKFGRFVEHVVNNESELVRVKAGTGGPPPNTTTPSPSLGGGKDGDVLASSSSDFTTALNDQATGYRLLDTVDLFNLLCVPGHTVAADLGELEAYCITRRAFLIADSVENTSFANQKKGPPKELAGANGTNAAFYYPWVYASDPTRENRPRDFPPSGFVAGLYAKTDATRGVWKAPAGIDASLTGALGLVENLTDGQNGELNPKAINCLREFDVYGTVIWGARTLRGNDELGSEWKYIPVRRTALFIEESLYRGLKWVVFEPNDEPLWAQIRLNVGAFMRDLFRQGAFQGTTPRDAYFVKCDRETTTQNDINKGIVNILVGFAPLKPAEFVIIRLQQIAGQIQV